MGYSIEEAWGFDDITKAEALAEFKAHGNDENSESWKEFLSSVGDKNEYTGAEVLGWLGY